MDNITTNGIISQQMTGDQTALLKDTIYELVHDYLKKVGDTVIEGTRVNNLYEVILAELEVPFLKAVMCYMNHNQSKMADLLGISRGTLRKKLRTYGLLSR